MKAILVIDEMPIKCEGCPLHYRKRQDIYRCEMTHKNIRLNNKPSWCPLKPMPEKRKLHQYVGDRCYHCRFFNGEKSTVGIACTNPMKEWRTRTAKYKQPSMKACKMFERKQGE